MGTQNLPVENASHSGHRPQVWRFKLSVFLQALEEEEKMTPEQLAIKNVGKQVSFLKIRQFSTVN